MTHIVSGKKLLSYIDGLNDSVLAEHFFKAVLEHSREKSPDIKGQSSAEEGFVYDLDAMACASALSEGPAAAQSTEVIHLIFSGYFEP